MIGAVLIERMMIIIATKGMARKTSLVEDSEKNRMKTAHPHGHAHTLKTIDKGLFRSV